MKKRILSLFLALCLMTTVIPWSAFAQNVLYGDVNSDGEINMHDVLAMQRYIAGEGNSIDTVAADVTNDGIINQDDVQLLKKYIAGWDVLLGLPFYTISFNSNGGAALNPVSVRQGDLIPELPSPAKENAVFLGWYTDSALTNQFYAETPVQSDLTLYAKYAAVENQQQAADNTFTLIDQATDLAFGIASTDPSMNGQAVLNGLTLENIGSSDYISLVVTGGSGSFTVSADGGFTAGASYKLTLDDESLTFADQASSYRICTFTIAKDEVIDITLNDDLNYIKSSDLSNIISDGQAVDTLFVALLGNTDTAVTGSFTYAGAGSLHVGDSVCVYTNVKPEDRDTVTDYSDDPIAYVEVTGISGTTVNFTSADAEDVLALPDTLPITESELTLYNPGGSFTANTSSLDFSSYTQLGLNAQTTVDKGDYIIITENDSDIIYGQVVSVTVNGGSTTVTFTVTTAQAIQGATLDYYTESDADGDVMLKDADVPALEKQITAQAEQSGFAESALGYLAYAATQTDSYQDITGAGNFIATTADGSAVKPGDVDLQKLGAAINGDDGITVTAEISDQPQHFGKGLRIAVSISGEITIDAGDENEVVINLSGSFVEEVRMTFNARGGAVWEWWGIFPYIADYKMNANIDVYDYSGISVSARITLKEKSVDISEELQKLMSTQSEAEISAGVQDLFTAYGDLLKNETDYVTLIDKNISETNSWVDPFCIIAYSFKIDFVVNLNLNLALGCNLEYMSGTRYNFWFAIIAKESGNSSMDLMDQSFHFQFYAMGHLGLRVGLQIEFAVGLFSTKLDSIGITAEAGAYVELFGYFIYQYDSVRAQGSTHTDTSSVMCGALYVEFGIYLEIAFKAQVLDSKYKYNPTLYEHEWPLLYAGDRTNVYDFGYSQPAADDVVLIKDVTNLTLPGSIRYMKCLDLKKGGLSVSQYGLDKFYYSLSNSHFALNQSTGVVSVTVPEDVRYMTCDLTITWKPAKLAFSSKDLSRTIHLVWTNLTNTELQQKYDVCVKVGNNIVWSARVNRGEIPVLPTAAEILSLIGYDRYVSNGINLKYTGYTGYGSQTVLPATGNQTYTFGVTEREYTLTVNGVQNPDGTTKSMAFTAKFGETFDMSALSSTGTSIAGTTYTSYLKTDGSSTAGKPVSSSIDSAFATQLLNGTYSYAAKYADNSCKVTYLFNTSDGQTIPSVTETIQKGTVPVFNYTDYLINQSGGYIAKQWDKAIDKVSADTTFTALCTRPFGDKHTITFDSNGGSSVNPIESYEGAAVTAPAAPVKTGYTFTGWYADAQLSGVYTFAKMPGNSITLYAGWTANQYTLTFDPNGGVCGTVSAAVTFGSPHGTLPTPTLTGFAFTGWYTALTGGTKIESAALVTVAANRTLYAHWLEKAVVTGLVTTGQTTTYNQNAQAFAVNGTGLTGFTVQYKKDGDADWSATAVNVGTYSVMITRPEDANYKAYEKTLTGVFVINKASRTIGAPAVTILNRTITVTPVTNFAGYRDGTVEYALNTTSAVPTTGWQTGRSFINLNANTLYYVFSKVAEGTNYLAANSAGRTATTGANTAAVGSAADGYIYYSGTLTTGDVLSAGTSAGNIVMKFMYDDNTTSDVNVISPSADMERNTSATYSTKSNRDPWTIYSFGIANLGKGSGAGWYGGSYGFTTYPGAGTNYLMLSQWFDDNYGTYVWFSSVHNSWKRTITSFGDFTTWGGTYTVDSTSSGNISLSYNGNVTDQFGTYNALAHEASPLLSVTPSLTGYDECFSYSMNALSIDKAYLYQKMAAANVNQIVFTVKLTFDSSSSKTLETTQTITINRQ